MCSFTVLATNTVAHLERQLTTSHGFVEFQPYLIINLACSLG